MIEVQKHGVILQQTKLDFENEGVLNPAAVREGDFVHLFYRAVSRGNYSSIGYCRLIGPLEIEERMKTPLISPEFNYERNGIEDPRIVKIEDLYYLTYTAYDGVNALGALAVSEDLINFKKQGIIVPQIEYEEFDALADTNNELDEKYYRYNQHNNIIEKEGIKIMLWDKDIIFFPRKINEKFCFLHRIKPEIQLVSGVESLEELTEEFWNNYLSNFKDNILFTPHYDHEISYVGGGCPPIETELGWLILYHGVQVSINGYVYSACAALFDIENPMKEIARLPYPLFKPEESWELKGDVNNVCFPTGAVVFDDILYVYYGAADERIGCASMNLPLLLQEILLYKNN